MKGSLKLKPQSGLFRRPRKAGKPEPQPQLSFEATPLFPLPPVQIGTLPDGGEWDFLRYVEPIGDAEMLAFQVAQITHGLGVIRRELDALKEEQLNEREP